GLRRGNFAQAPGGAEPSDDEPRTDRCGAGRTPVVAGGRGEGRPRSAGGLHGRTRFCGSGPSRAVGRQQPPSGGPLRPIAPALVRNGPLRSRDAARRPDARASPVSGRPPEPLGGLVTGITATPVVSVVVPMFNARAALPGLVAALRAQTIPPGLA